MPAPARRRLRRLLGRDGAATGPATTSDIDRIYAESQSVAAADRPATDAELRELADAWQDADIPAVQRRVVDLPLLGSEIAAVGFDPVATIDVYPAASSQPKSGSVAVDERGAIRSDRTLTLVFRRRPSIA